MISLRGNLWYILQNLFLFFGAVIYTMLRRLARGPLRPTRNGLVEMAHTYLRWQGRQAARLKRIEDQRAFSNAMSFRPDYSKGMKVESVNMDGIPARRFTPEQTNRVTMLYLHGGGYVFYNRAGDQLIGHIAQAAQADTWVPDYRLAPENPYPAAIEDAVDAYRSLVVSGVDPKRLIVAGDSAGGGLAVATLLRARRLGLKMPALVILVSPWVDLNSSGKSMRTNAAYDFINSDQLRTWSGWYAGAHDLKDPLISPLFADDLKGLPPFLIQAGKDEILYDSIVEFSARAKAQGVEVLLEILPEMPHDFQAFALRTPQSTQALQQIRREVWRRLPDEPPQVLQCLPDLAIFRAEVRIPQSVFENLWMPLGLSRMEIQEVLDWMVQRQRINKPEERVFSLAPYQLSGLHATDLPARHQRMLKAYRSLCQGNWPKGPKDGYYFENLAYHFKGAEWQAELGRLLLNFDWLWARLKATDIAALISDFNYLVQPLEDHQLVVEALRLSESVLEQDKTQLPAQLRGRLLWIVNQIALAPSPARRTGLLARFQRGSTPPSMENGGSALPRLLEKAMQWNESAWLCPMNACLIAPNGPKEGRQTSPGLAVVVSANYQRALAVLDGRTIQVWDVTQGVLVASLRGHSGMIFSLGISANGRVAVSAAEDATVRVWDLETGAQRFLLKGHVGRVWSVALTPNGKTAVSVGEDGILRVWDVRRGRLVNALQGYKPDIHETTPAEEANPIPLERLQGHTQGAGSVAITPNGSIAVSGGPDGVLRLWDLKAGQEAYVFKGHQAGIVWVGIAWHGRRAFSISHDRQLKVWDLDRNRLLQTFEWPLPQSAEVKAAVKELLKVLHVPSLEKAVEAMATAGQDDRIVKALDGLMKAMRFPPLDMLLDALMDVLNVTNLDAAMVALAKQRNNPVIAGALYRLIDALDVPSLDKAPQALLAGSPDPAVKRIVQELLDALDAPALGLEKAVQTVLAAPNDNAVAVAIDASQAILPIQAHVLQWINLETGQRHKLGSHGRPIWAAGIDSDGTQAVSASLDTTLKLWQLSTRQCLTTYYCNGEVTFCAMSPYGQMIVAGDQAGFLHFLRPIQPG